MEKQGGEQEGQMYISHRSPWLLCVPQEMKARAAEWWLVDGRKQVVSFGKKKLMSLVKGEGWGTQAQLWLGQLRWGPQQVSDDEGLHLQGA